MPDDAKDATSLKRSLGFWSLAIYGIGDILGAGIYALVGKVAGEAGSGSWLAFLIAMFAAALTGLSYAELVSRHPRSAGEATYTLHAFRRPWLGFLVGWLVFCSGVVSMSAVAHACAGYVQSVAGGVPEWSVWLLFVAFVSGVNFWGIRQSSMTNIIFTLIEASGLFLVIVVGLWFVFGNGAEPAVVQNGGDWTFGGAFSGAALAFFAYIGFEDMINVAEEVEEPQRNFPRAIITAVAFCGTVYLVISLVALAVVPAAALAASDAPLLEVVRRAAPAVPDALYVLIALIAVANTGLLNSIMASRLLYGMADQGLLPRALAKVHPKTQTPHWSVLTIAAVSLALIASGTLSRLASTTSFLLLIVFSIVNLSLIVIRRREGRAEGRFTVPIIVPVAAIVVCIVMAAFIEPTALLWGGGLLLLGIIPAIASTRRSIDVEQLDADGDSEPPDSNSGSGIPGDADG